MLYVLLVCLLFATISEVLPKGLSVGGERAYTRSKACVRKIGGISVESLIRGRVYRWRNTASAFVRSYYLLRSKKAFVYANIHFEGRIYKPPFLYAFVRRSVNSFTNTEVWICVFVQKLGSVNGALSTALKSYAQVISIYISGGLQNRHGTFNI